MEFDTAEGTNSEPDGSGYVRRAAKDGTLPTTSHLHSLGAHSQSFQRTKLCHMVAERVIPSTGAHPGLRTPHSARPDPGIVTPRSPGSVIRDSGVQDY